MTPRLTRRIGLALLLLCGAVSAEPPPDKVVPPAAPYSLPWQLRPAGVANVLRLETSIAGYEQQGDAGLTAATMFLASWKLRPSLAPVVRLAIVYNDEPDPAVGAGVAVVNPLIGLSYAPRVRPPWRVALFGGLALPLGQGGANSPALDATAAAAARGIPARAGMDNAMFAVNYATPLVGADVAYVSGGLTVQAEATVLQLLRTRNEAFAPEGARTNSTFGLHTGYFVTPKVSLGVEVRYQRWLSTPGFVRANPAARDTLTVAAGLRVHAVVGGARVQPGIAFSRALDDPLAAGDYGIVQIDVPVAF